MKKIHVNYPYFCDGEMLMPGMVYGVQNNDADFLLGHGLAFPIGKTGLELKSNDDLKTTITGPTSKERSKANKRSGSSGNSRRNKKQPKDKRLSNK